MSRRYTVPATGLTRESLPEKPYLWHGKRDLAEACAGLAAERADAERAGAKRPPIQFFSWPQPLPGPPARAGSGSDAAKARRRQEARTGEGMTADGA
jgi:hypothetical protein